MHKKILVLLLAFVVVFDFTGCAMSAQARRERAYRHYAAKQMKQRQKAMARAQKAANREMKLKMKSIEPSEPKLTTSVEDVSSESVWAPAPQAPPQPAPPFKEPTVDPITVSASAEISASQNPNQPSPP